ncbi:hypothetical protein BJX76DRAFT_342691 [Aspergillus varians]
MIDAKTIATTVLMTTTSARTSEMTAKRNEATAKSGRKIAPVFLRKTMFWTPKTSALITTGPNSTCQHPTVSRRNGEYTVIMTMDRYTPTPTVT